MHGALTVLAWFIIFVLTVTIIFVPALQDLTQGNNILKSLFLLVLSIPLITYCVMKITNYGGKNGTKKFH